MCERREKSLVFLRYLRELPFLFFLLFEVAQLVYYILYWRMLMCARELVIFLFFNDMIGEVIYVRLCKGGALFAHAYSTFLRCFYDLVYQFSIAIRQTKNNNNPRVRK